MTLDTRLKRHSFRCQGKEVAIYWSVAPRPVEKSQSNDAVPKQKLRLASSPDKNGSPKYLPPVIYLNIYGDEGMQIAEELLAVSDRDFVLVTISGLDWNRDMSPWDAPSISKESQPSTGGADEYLKVLTDEIIPRTEAWLAGEYLDTGGQDSPPDTVVPVWRGIAGYSLAGLFAIYSLYKTAVFDRAASISGSLWFPHFKDYAENHALAKKPDRLYFSVGDREARTRNQYLKTVQVNTEELADYYRSLSVEVKYELNEGNHFNHEVKRTVKGLAWLLE